MAGFERDHCLLAAVILFGDLWVVGGLLVGASVPFTLFIMMPINNRLLDENSPPTADEVFRC